MGLFVICEQELVLVLNLKAKRLIKILSRIQVKFM